MIKVLAILLAVFTATPVVAKCYNEIELEENLMRHNPGAKWMLSDGSSHLRDALSDWVASRGNSAKEYAMVYNIQLSDKIVIFRGPEATTNPYNKYIAFMMLEGCMTRARIFVTEKAFDAIVQPILDAEKDPDA